MMNAIFALPIFLFLVVAAGATLLRAAVSLANKVLGPVGLLATPEPLFPIGPPGTKPADSAVSENPFATRLQIPAASPDQAGNPYAAPAVPATGAIPSAPFAQKAVPEPEFGKAMGIAFMQAIVIGLTNFLIVFFFPETTFLLGALSFTACVLLSIAIYTNMIPTSFGKAALICLFQVLTAIVFVIAVALVVFAMAAVLG